MSLQLKKYNILSTFQLHRDALELFHPSEYNVVQYNKSDSVINESEFMELLQANEYHGIICTLTTTISPDIYNIINTYQHNKCKIISTMSVGYDHIDIPGATKNNILIGYTPNVLNDTVADTVIALCLITGRKILPAIQSVQNGTWASWQPLNYCGIDLHHSTVGIIGLGRIALAVIQRLRAFKCNIIYTGRSRKLDIEQQYNVRFVELTELVSTSDFVIPQCSLNDSTRHMFNSALFQLMKPTACFINTTRGGIVDEYDLYVALRDNIIGGAGLDVAECEPLRTDHPLLSLSNCIILPHIGSASVRTRIDMMKLASTNVINALNNTTKDGQYVNIDHIK